MDGDSDRNCSYRLVFPREVAKTAIAINHDLFLVSRSHCWHSRIHRSMGDRRSHASTLLHLTHYHASHLITLCAENVNQAPFFIGAHRFAGCDLIDLRIDL